MNHASTTRKPSLQDVTSSVGDWISSELPDLLGEGATTQTVDGAVNAVDAAFENGTPAQAERALTFLLKQARIGGLINEYVLFRVAATSGAIRVENSALDLGIQNYIDKITRALSLSEVFATQPSNKQYEAVAKHILSEVDTVVKNLGVDLTLPSPRMG